MMVGRVQTGPKTTYRGRRVNVGAKTENADDRWTPQSFVDRLERELGIRFTVDVAASKHNRKCRRFFDKRTNGLAQTWAGEVVFCNPPYSDIEPWIVKALDEVLRGGCVRVVMLLPANRTEQAWWQDHIEPLRDRGRGVTVRFLRGRIRFQNVRGPIVARKGRFGGTRGHKGGQQPPFGNVLVIIERPKRALRRAA